MQWPARVLELVPLSHPSVINKMRAPPSLYGLTTAVTYRNVKNLLQLLGSATLRATQGIINASHNQRQRFFHLSPELHGCCDYSRKSARTERQQAFVSAKHVLPHIKWLNQAVERGVDCSPSPVVRVVRLGLESHFCCL
jgi:hypothetical protein